MCKEAGAEKSGEKVLLHSIFSGLLALQPLAAQGK